MYDEFDAQRRPMGVTAYAVYQALDDPSDVTVWHNFATCEQAQALMSSDALRETPDRAFLPYWGFVGVCSSASVFI